MRPHRRVGQLRDDNRARGGGRHDCRGLPAHDRRHVPQKRARHPRGAEAHAAVRSRNDRAGRLRAVSTEGSAAGDLLRRQHAIRGFVESFAPSCWPQRYVRLTIVHLTGMNTPQFGQVKTTLAHHPQPVPPIYQPNVAAEAIVWGAHHDRREISVGWPTIKTTSASGSCPATSIATWPSIGSLRSRPTSRSGPTGPLRLRAGRRRRRSWFARHLRLALAVPQRTAVADPAPPAGRGDRYGRPRSAWPPRACPHVTPADGSSRA